MVNIVYFVLLCGRILYCIVFNVFVFDVFYCELLNSIWIMMSIE